DSDGAGVCDARPDACTTDLAPVCGCDRRSYTNGCAAHSESTSLLHEGDCSEDDCAAVDGHSVDGSSGGCPDGEQEYTRTTSTGDMSGAQRICCVATPPSP